MNIITPLSDCYLAISGGVDSMFGYHFLTRNKQRKVLPIFFDHGTETSRIALEFLRNNVELHSVGCLSRDKTAKESPEEFFRHQRYQFFDQFTDMPIVTCHHLNDQVETFFLSSLTGKIRRIPYRRGNYVRPFLNVTKREILRYAAHKGIRWVDDQTNIDPNIPRNNIRLNVIPALERINPSFYKHHTT